MSFSSNGVTFNKTKWIRNRIFKILFRGAEGILSVLFVISMAAPMVFPNHAYGAVGVSKILSYQGRLTDVNGNPVANGTYCMQFSLYTASSGGTKVWPAGAPSTMTVGVTNGIFNVGVGDVAAGGNDLANTNWNTSYSNGFVDTDTTYLNVDVYTNPGASCTGGSWESLAPRQRMDAVAYARTAEDVYGTALRTSTTTVKIGAGTGQNVPIWLNLDWKNTATTLGAACSTVSATNGAVWYNSSGTRALACINNIIVALDNASEIASLNISGNTAGTPAAITAGGITLVGGNNITLSQNGSSIVVSGDYAHDVYFGGNTSGTMATVSTGSLLFAGGNNITLSQVGNAVTISGQPAHGVIINTNGNTAGVSASISSGYLTLNGGNNITLSQVGNAITISAGAGGGGIPGIAGSGASTVTNGTLQFANANGVSFGLNGSTMTASVAAAGGGATLQRFEFPVGMFTSLGTAAQGSLSLEHIYVPFNVTGTALKIGGSLSMATNTRATTASVNFSLNMGIYTLNGSTLSLASSGSANNGFAWWQTASTTGNTSVQSMRQMTVPININMTPGEYWIGAVLSSATTYTSGAFTLFGAGSAQINMAATGAVLSPIGSATGLRDAFMLQGIYTAATNAMPATIVGAGVNNSSASNVQRAGFYGLIYNATY